MKFEEMKLLDEIKEAIKKMNYIDATDVQAETIPQIFEGHNVIVKSHTGSGKTAAFGIPISQNIFQGKAKSALVLCPTRELAVQVKDEIRQINSRTRLSVHAFYGGHGMSAEVRSAKEGVDILCATPGRLLDHFRNRSLDPRQFDIVVLDEADRILDMGFINDIRKILNYVKPKKTHLFSATLDGSVANLIKEYIPTYEEITISHEIIGTSILERHIKVPREDRMAALAEVLNDAKGKRVLVFVSTKRNADFLARKLYKAGHNVESIHGDKSQRSREYALENFKSGKVSVLVATDVAARGLQIDDVEYVVNYDLAGDADTYKHRIGRTGRMGDTGHAISFVGEDGRFIDMKRGFGGGGRGGGFRSSGSSNFRGNRNLWRQGGQSDESSGTQDNDRGQGFGQRGGERRQSHGFGRRSETHQSHGQRGGSGGYGSRGGHGNYGPRTSPGGYGPRSGSGSSGPRSGTGSYSSRSGSGSYSPKSGSGRYGGKRGGGMHGGRRQGSPSHGTGARHEHGKGTFRPKKKMEKRVWHYSE